MVPPPSEEMALFEVLLSHVMALSLALPLAALVGPEGGQNNVGEDLLELQTMDIDLLQLNSFKQNELKLWHI